MKAQEMFEQLGYVIRQHKFENVWIDYENEEKEAVITFLLDTKTFFKSELIDEDVCLPITIGELKAINQQCKELGWIE